jgi:hypothetical protein
MGAWRNLPGLVSALLLLNVMFASAMFADDVASQHQLRLTVLSAESHAINAGTPVPKNCDLSNFDAYCNESKNPTAQTILLVQDANGKTYRIVCIADSRWSKCAPLPVGETFDARAEKKGFTIEYRNVKGKEHKQFYQFIAEVSAPQPGVAATPQPHAAAPQQNSPAPESAPQAAAPPPSSTPAPHAAAPPQNSPVPAPVPPPAAAQGFPKGKVKCNFSSTPSGADITIDDWKYVGSTPSEISLSTGTHVVVISMPGFAEWKRELTVAPDSVVNVAATLQKTQP